MSCVVCKEKWKTRENTKYPDLGSESVPMIFGMQLIANMKGDRVKLTFCDLHGNNHMRYTKFFNGVLKIKNVITGKWVFAKRLGDIVKA